MSSFMLNKITERKCTAHATFPTIDPDPFAAPVHHFLRQKKWRSRATRRAEPQSEGVTGRVMRAREGDHLQTGLAPFRSMLVVSTESVPVRYNDRGCRDLV